MQEEAEGQGQGYKEGNGQRGLLPQHAKEGKRDDDQVSKIS